MTPLVVIPARLQSTRLPRKLLLRDSGKYLVQHVWEQARAAARVERVVVATDSEELRAACGEFGAEALMTSAEHRSGTDRVAEAARILAGRGEAFDLVVNVQGDEPELDPAHVDQLVALMGDGDPMGTLAEELSDSGDLERPQVVKVVVDAASRALYFSRAPIPHGARPGGAPPVLRHVGLYAYRPDLLQTLCRLEPCPLERVERLEQLRALYHGHAIRVGVVAGGGARGIDTPEDYAAFLARRPRGRPDPC